MRANSAQPVIMISVISAADSVSGYIYFPIEPYIGAPITKAISLAWEAPKISEKGTR